MGRQEFQPFVIEGRAEAPLTSWWIDAVGPAGFTRYVEAKQLKRMRMSKFSLLEPRTDCSLAVPRNDEYRYGEVEA